ncbi:hypothetical protein [Endozoicomonas sp. ONNA1]|uniref:hypothetical protein n=1 Tax=Endozoicomonas sp. ONNA1 TaxID=2828740 RepID=UPI002148FC15|nr:hypothetical protein [Endozoicomonas sp. ONNA1]
MRNSLSAALLLLLLVLPVVGQAELLSRDFVVEFEQDGGAPKGSFSIKRDLNAVSYNPSCCVDTNNDAGSIFPPEDKPYRHGSYGETTSLIESISWELIYATHLLLAYKLVLTTSDNSLGAKAYSWLPVEAFAAVGLLLKSYWNAHSPLFNTMDQLEAASMLMQENHPVLITTRKKPENGEGQNGQQNQPQSQPSQSQASGTMPHLMAAFSSFMSSGSGGGGNQGPEQPLHTMSFNCYVDSCHGFCRLRQFGSSESVAGSRSSERSSTGHTNRGMTGTRTYQLGVGSSMLIVIPSIAFRDRQNSASIGHLVAGFDPSTCSEPWVRTVMLRSEADRFPFERFRPYGVMVSDANGDLRELGNHTMSFNCFFDSCNGFCRLRQSGGSESVEGSLSFEGSSAGLTHHGMTGTQTFQPQAGGSPVSVIPSGANGEGQNWRQNQPQSQPSQSQASGEISHLVAGFDPMSCGFGRGSSFLNTLSAESLPFRRLRPISDAHNPSTELAGTPEDSNDTRGTGQDDDVDME